MFFPNRKTKKVTIFPLKRRILYLMFCDINNKEGRSEKRCYDGQSDGESDKQRDGRREKCRGRRKNGETDGIKTVNYWYIRKRMKCG